MPNRFRYERLGYPSIHASKVVELLLRQGNTQLAIAYAQRFDLPSDLTLLALEPYPMRTWKKPFQRMQAAEEADHLAYEQHRAQQQARQAAEKEVLREAEKRERRRVLLLKAATAEHARIAEEAREVEAQLTRAKNVVAVDEAAARDAVAAAAAAEEEARAPPPIPPSSPERRRAIHTVAVQIARQAIRSAEREITDEYAGDAIVTPLFFNDFSDDFDDEDVGGG